jgi:hypothetical protein
MLTRKFFPHGIRTVSVVRQMPYPTIQGLAEVLREPNTPVWFQGCERAGFSYASLQIVNKLIGNPFPF